MAKVSMSFLVLIIISCNEKKDNIRNYFSGQNFEKSIRQWDTFIYNSDTSEFYFGTSMWDPSGIPHNAQIEYLGGICKVKVYNSNKKSGLLYTGFCKVYKGIYKDRSPIVWWPFKQFVLYQDSICLGYDKIGNVQSRTYFNYCHDTLFSHRLVFDTITDFEERPYPFIGSRNMLIN